MLTTYEPVEAFKEPTADLHYYQQAKGAPNRQEQPCLASRFIVLAATADPKESDSPNAEKDYGDFGGRAHMSYSSTRPEGVA